MLVDQNDLLCPGHSWCQVLVILIAFAAGSDRRVILIRGVVQMGLTFGHRNCIERLLFLSSSQKFNKDLENLLLLIETYFSLMSLSSRISSLFWNSLSGNCAYFFILFGLILVIKYIIHFFKT